MTYHVYVSQHATYRYTVQADTVEEANAKVTEAIGVRAKQGPTGRHAGSGVGSQFEVGNYVQTNLDWDITDTVLSDPWPKR